MRPKPLVVLLLVLGLALSGCGAEEAEPPATSEVPVAMGGTSTGPGYDPGWPAPPSPTGTPFGGEATSVAPASPSATIASTTTVATSVAPGWTRYTSINDIRALDFASDNVLWAATRGGLVRWDLDTGRYTRYLVEASDLAVAADGTVWLAVQNGLCQFDGVTCKIFTDADGLISNAVRAIETTPEGTVWVGTDGGVSRFDGRSWKSYSSPVPTLDLAIGANGEVWAATPGGVGRYLSDEDTWITYTEEHGLPALTSKAVAADPGGQVWAYLLWQGVYRFDGAAWQAVAQVPGGLVSDLAFAADGMPWAASIGGLHGPGGSLAYHRDDQWMDVTSQHGLHSISTLALGPGGMVAAGTNLGLGIYQGGEWRLLRDGPTQDRISTVAVTPDGVAWFGFGDYSGTPSGGLGRFDGQDWQYMFGDAAVSVLVVGPDGSLWAGVACEVQRFDGVTWETVGRCEQDLPLGNILDIAFTPDGAVWVASALGKLSRYDGESWTVFGRFVHSLDVAPDGTLWMNGWEGTQGSQYVARFNGQDWTAFRSTDSWPGGFLAGAVTPDGLVWGIVPDGRLASFDGRSWTDEDSWAFYDPGGHLSLVSTSNLTAAPDGALWVRAEGAVARFDPQRDSAEAWTVYGEDGDLTNDLGGPLAFAPDGAIWFGATRFQPEEVTFEQPALSTGAPAATSSVPTEPAGTPYCSPAGTVVDLQVSTPALEVGQVVSVTVLLVNEAASGVRLGQPQYRLVVQPGILVPVTPELLRHTSSLGPGEPEQVEFVLRAETPGQATLTAMTDYEVHALDYSWGSWSGCRSGPLEIVVEP